MPSCAVLGCSAMIGTKVALLEMPIKPEQRSKWEFFLRLYEKNYVNVIYKLKLASNRKILIAGAVLSIVKQGVSSIERDYNVFVAFYKFMFLFSF